MSVDRSIHSRTDQALRRGAAIVALGLVSLVYLRTMPPGLVGIGRGLWDSQETQAVGLTWGYLHPPGYPLQSLLANLLAHSLGALPGVEPGWGVTLLSVVAMVLAAACVYHIVVRLTGHHVAALLAMVVFAFSTGPWHTAITPEVYGLNMALWALVLWLTLRAADVSRSWIDFWLGLAMGLAAGHHRTALLLVPAALLYLGMRRNWSLAWGRLLLGVFVSATVYLYLPLADLWRSPMTPGDALSLGGFWELISARTWSVFFQIPASLGDLATRLENVRDALADQLGLAGSGLGILGLAWLFSRRPARLARLMLLGLPIVGLLVFALVYQVPDVATMLGPLILILCVGLGGLVAGGWNLGANLWHKAFLADLRSGLPAFGYRLSAVLLVAIAGGGLLVHNYGRVDESGDRSGQAVIAELACELSGTPGETWLTAESGYAGPLVTYIGQRIGRPLVWANPWGDWDYLGALAQGRRVFLLNDMPGGWQYPDALKRLSAPYRYLLPTGSPDLLELVAEPPYSSAAGQEPAGSRLPLDAGYVALDKPFGSAILLRGYAWRTCDRPQGRLLRLVLYWQAQAQVDQDWRVKAHLIDGQGAMLAQADSEHPVRGAQPTSSWQPGQVVRDVHDFYLPANADLQSARAVVGLYQIVGDQFPTLAETEIEVKQGG